MSVCGSIFILKFSPLATGLSENSNNFVAGLMAR
uniref:Uncharacterized protein n=1 Tax=Rhizophora mucronata TaxID=61149 RepID=A0A2P2NJ11_RHIMU